MDPLLTQSFLVLYSFCANLLHSLIIIIIIYSFMSFPYQCLLIVPHWSLSDSKSPQVSRTLLSILAYLNNAVVWMVSTRPLIFNSSSTFISLLVTVPRVPITISITVTFMFYNFFSSLARFRYSSFFTLLSNCVKYLSSSQQDLEYNDCIFSRKVKLPTKWASWVCQ